MKTTSQSVTYTRQSHTYKIMESGGKSSGSNGLVLESRPAGSRCGDCANGSIGDWQQAAWRARGLTGIVARGGGPAGAAGDLISGLADHPAPQFATADLSTFPSGNHPVRFLVRYQGWQIDPGWPVRVGLTDGCPPQDATHLPASYGRTWWIADLATCACFAVSCWSRSGE